MIRNFILGSLTLLSASMSRAQLNEEEAKKLQGELEYMHKEADRFRYLMVADEISINSTEVNDKEFAALLALQAYNFNSKQSGYSSNCNIYSGLASALINYGLLPKILNKQNQKINVNSNEEKQTFENIKNDVLKQRLAKEISKNELIEFSHSGYLIASASKERGIRVWNLKNIKERPIVIHENSSIKSFEFTEDDLQVVCILNSPKDNSVVHLWPLKLDSMADELCSLLKSNMTKNEWEQYVGSLPYESTCKNLPTNNK